MTKIEAETFTDALDLLQGSSGAPATLADRAMRLIYHDVTSGQLEPGRRLKPEELKARYGVGASPIREALIRLAGWGLVLREGHCGFRAPEATERELRDIAEVRRHLSGQALAKSIELGDDDWEAAVVAAFHRMERMRDFADPDPAVFPAEWERRNQAFHHALESACGSPWLRHFCAVAHSQAERYRRYFLDAAPGGPLPLAERIAMIAAPQAQHRQIMEAALARDVDRAVALLGDHIEAGVTKVLEAMRLRGALAA
jgi:GntR family carbon starvation induced transcriptional regulator